MTSQELLIRRLMDIEAHDLSPEQGRWSEAAYASEMESEEAEIFFWPAPENFNAFVLYRVLPFEEVWVMNWASEVKGAGQGSQVFRAFLRFCTEQGFRQIGLEVRERNAAAIKIYEKLGFQDWGRREAYYASGEAARVFGLGLGH